MKLKSLNINSYRHLLNLNFDFMYPKEHEKAGQPLNKICIIGQSATGKTSILELIKNTVSKLISIEVVSEKYFFTHFQLDVDGQLEFLQNDQLVQITNNIITKNGQELINSGSSSGTIEKLFNDGIKLSYLSSELISKEALNIFNQSPINILDTLSSDRRYELLNRKNDSTYVYEFVLDINVEIWFALLYKILDYRKRFTQMASEVINKGAIADVNRLAKQFSKWAETNENPLTGFANVFNPILMKLNLEIDLINTEYPVPIKSRNKDEAIPISDLSTGTKGLLLSMFPLYHLDTSDSIILIDEPERSLFPDIQMDLISHYQRLAPNSQIIVATHSPFIAAAFEPEERFILSFNEQENVTVRRGSSPIGDDPNDILRNDFNVDYYNEFGKKAYKEYLALKRKVSQEKQPEKKKELLIELTELGDKYNF